MFRFSLRTLMISMAVAATGVVGAVHAIDLYKLTVQKRETKNALFANEPGDPQGKAVWKAIDKLQYRNRNDTILAFVQLSLENRPSVNADWIARDSRADGFRFTLADGQTFDVHLDDIGEVGVFGLYENHIFWVDELPIPPGADIVIATMLMGDKPISNPVQVVGP